MKTYLHKPIKILHFLPTENFENNSAFSTERNLQAESRIKQKIFLHDIHAHFTSPWML